MSSDESQEISASRRRDTSEMDCDIDSFLSSHYVRSLDMDIQTAEKKKSNEQQKIMHESQKIMCETASDSVNSLRECKENKPINHEVEENIKMAASPSKKIPSPYHSQERSHSSNLSTPERKKDNSPSPTSKRREEADRSSSNLKTQGYEEFYLSDYLPLTKEKLAESFSLEEACGLLSILMKSKHPYLKGEKNQLDQFSVDILTALHKAKDVCFLLGSVPENEPQDIHDAREQSKRLLDLLSESSDIFEKVFQLVKSLFENIDVYSKHSGEHHSNVEILLEYIMEKLLERCRKIQRKN